MTPRFRFLLIATAVVILASAAAIYYAANTGRPRTSIARLAGPR